MSNLTSIEIQKFWIRVYLGTSKESKIKIAIIDRAYRDFNRTLSGIEQTKLSSQILKEKMLSIIEHVENHRFESQNEFDQWHKKICDELKSLFWEYAKYPVKYGQTQKWINMSLKYAFATYYEKDNGITQNYKYFHIPIDNIIQEKFEEVRIERIKGAWSKLDDYQEYINYQIKVRETYPNQIPMDVEFNIFNEYDS